MTRTTATGVVILNAAMLSPHLAELPTEGVWAVELVVRVEASTRDELVGCPDMPS